MKQVPEKTISLLKSHLDIQDSHFLFGFCNCLSYQYPCSDLSDFYGHFCSIDSSITFQEALKQFFDETYYVDGGF